MAINSWDKGLREENESLKQQLMISSTQIRPNQIMLPFVPKDAETDDMYGEGVEKIEGKGTQARLTSKQKREAFDKFVIDWRKQNSLDGTDVMPPTEVVPLWMRRAEGSNKNMTIAHQGQHYGPHGQPIEDPAKGMLPSGELIHMEHMEQSPEEHKRNKEMHIKNYGQQAGATSRQIRNKLKPYTKGGPADYDKEGGSLRNLPASLRIQLLKA